MEFSTIIEKTATRELICERNFDSAVTLSEEALKMRRSIEADVNLIHAIYFLGDYEQAKELLDQQRYMESDMNKFLRHLSKGFSYYQSQGLDTRNWLTNLGLK